MSYITAFIAFPDLDSGLRSITEKLRYINFYINLEIIGCSIDCFKYCEAGGYPCFRRLRRSYAGPLTSVIQSGRSVFLNGQKASYYKNEQLITQRHPCLLWQAFKMRL